MKIGIKVFQGDRNKKLIGKNRRRRIIKRKDKKIKLFVKKKINIIKMLGMINLNKKYYKFILLSISFIDLFLHIYLLYL